jgi:hypothetical protein
LNWKKITCTLLIVVVTLGSQSSIQAAKPKDTPPPKGPMAPVNGWITLQSAPAQILTGWARGERRKASRRLLRIEDIKPKVLERLEKRLVEAIRRQSDPSGQYKWLQRTSGNVGFMLGAWIEMQLSAAFTGDPASVEAANAAFGELGGWLSLTAFSLASERTGHFLSTAGNGYLQYKLGPQWISSLSLVGGSLANSAFSKVWYSPYRVKAGRDLREMFHSFNFTDADLTFWSNQSKEESALIAKRDELLVKLEKPELKPDERYSINVEMKVTLDQLDQVRPRLAKYSERFWDHAVAMVCAPEKVKREGHKLVHIPIPMSDATFNTCHTAKELTDGAIHVGQLVMVASGVHYFRSFYTKAWKSGMNTSSAFFMRAFVDELKKEVAKLPAHELPAAISVLPNGQLGYYNPVGRAIPESAMRQRILKVIKPAVASAKVVFERMLQKAKAIKAVSKQTGIGIGTSALHAVEFLMADKLLAMPAVTVLKGNAYSYFGDLDNKLIGATNAYWYCRSEEPKDLSGHVAQALGPALFRKTNDCSAELDEPNYKAFVKAISSWDEEWEKYGGDAILFKFNARLAEWQGRLDIIQNVHSRRLNYFEWFVRSWKEGIGQKMDRPHEYEDMLDRDFLSNGGSGVTGIQWHEDTEYKEFQEEKNYYRQEFNKEFKDIFDEYVAVFQQKKSFKTEQELKAWLDALVKKLDDKKKAFFEKQQLLTNSALNSESVRLKHYLSEILDGALYNNTEPLWLKTLSIPIFAPLSKVFRSTGVYSLKALYQKQFAHLRNTFLKLPQTNAFMAAYLKQALTQWPTLDEEGYQEFFMLMMSAQVTVQFKDADGKLLPPKSREDRENVTAYYFARHLSKVYSEYHSLSHKRGILLKDKAARALEDKMLAEAQNPFMQNLGAKETRVVDPFGSSDTGPVANGGVPDAKKDIEEGKTDISDLKQTLREQGVKEEELEMLDIILGGGQSSEAPPVPVPPSVKPKSSGKQ